MCGIAGFLANRTLPLDATIRDISSRLSHRGPDDAGVWVDDSMGLALGHRRLSIVDLSPHGHQPMRSACGRYIIVFNGEIYNFAEIRRRLESAGQAPAWRGHSDTEVTLAAFTTWGIEPAIKSFVGMFAFALWDREERALHLVRDRIGEKPLYYGTVPGGFVFASELKAIEAFPDSSLEIDREAVSEMLQFGYIPAPRSIYRGIHKLEPGNLVTIHATGQGLARVGASNPYWSIDYSGLQERRRQYEASDDEQLVGELQTLLTSAIGQQMVADVPLGAFLSGGVDSSTVVALMQAQSARPVRTFTIGFHEKAYNEAHHAKAVAGHLGTDHTELYVTASEAANVIPQLSHTFDEPFADSSQIPTILVSRMTRRHVTVSLSGDGGDELFGGYPRYQFGERLWNRIRMVPSWSSRAAARSIATLSARSWDRMLSIALPKRMRSSVTGYRMHRLAHLLGSGSLGAMYVGLVSQWPKEDGVVLGADRERKSGLPQTVSIGTQSSLNQMRQFDIEQYLPDDILVKVDRAAMSVSLESRAPFLDHRVVEFAWALPERMLVRAGTGKWILRQVLDRHVPRALIERPKSGFGIPVAEWLRTDLRDWANNLLDERKLREQGFLSPEPVRLAWQQHLAGTHDRQAHLWNVLMFQAWLEARKEAG